MTSPGRKFKRGPRCGRTFRDQTCMKIGPHYCLARVGHVDAFFTTRLVHTKGRWARQPFILADWQADHIVHPLFGHVAWSEEHDQYVRSYKHAWIEIARKNGKSELLAGIALFLLYGDGEEGAEVYGAAKDREQASIVFDVAERMVELSPILSRRLEVRRSPKRILYRDLGAFYAPVARDATGNLGQNPHGIIFDEVITQPDATLWDAMRTGMGARVQPMMLAATTAGADQSSFAHNEHAECERIAADPSRQPNRLVYIRNLPRESDPYDEANWAQANPALGDFLSPATLREEAAAARNDPRHENTFRQFRCNQWVSQSTRWMPMHLYDACSGEPWLTPEWRSNELAGREAWVGLDLAAKHDLTAACVLLPDEEGKPADAMYRFWLPEDAVDTLRAVSDNLVDYWISAGWLTVTEGAVLDHRQVVRDLVATLKPFTVREIDYDKWSGDYIRLEFEDHYGQSVPLVANEPGFSGMTVPMNELMNLTTTVGWAHHANPIARWCFDAVEVTHMTTNPDLIRPAKPERNTGQRRIDGVIATALAVGGWKIRGQIKPKPRRVYGFR
jgi:phage terminase large subunit-like protein